MPFDSEAMQLSRSLPAASEGPLAPRQGQGKTCGTIAAILSHTASENVQANDVGCASFAKWKCGDFSITAGLHLTFSRLCIALV
jgi:hypothetical protein